jgi:ribosomal protein L32
MGAVPKNKITSAERGKRRSGQLRQLKLKKDPNQSAVPLHKRGLVAEMFSQMEINFQKFISKK